jgi:hypothetical protein
MIRRAPKRIAKSTGKLDRRQRDNKKTPGNTPSLRPCRYKMSEIRSKMIWTKPAKNMMTKQEVLDTLEKKYAFINACLIEAKSIFKRTFGYEI